MAKNAERVGLLRQELLIGARMRKVRLAGLVAMAYQAISGWVVALKTDIVTPVVTLDAIVHAINGGRGGVVWF